MVCYCGGDIDDCEFNGPGSGQERCSHQCDINGASLDEFDPDDRDQPERLVADCGYEGCCMPGLHFPSECHNAQDIEAWYAEHEKSKPTCTCQG